MRKQSLLMAGTDHAAPGGSRHREPKQTGFTLMELLISMTIVSLLVTTVLFGWRIASSAWQRASAHLERSRTVLETQRLLEEQMASMVPYQAELPDGSLGFFFEGEPQTARFISRYTLAGRLSSGLYRIEYQIAEAADGTKQLLLNEFPVRGRDELGALITVNDNAGTRTFTFAPVERGPQTVVLLKGLTECRFEYYASPVPPEPGSWQAPWTSPLSELPKGMAIRISAKPDPANLQPVTIVAAVRNFSLRRQ